MDSLEECVECRPGEPAAAVLLIILILIVVVVVVVVTSQGKMLSSARSLGRDPKQHRKYTLTH